MGKNHIENSLKRFLKRKVKITLGFVVAFMISGTVGFADVIMQEDEREIAKEYLKGTILNNYEQKNFSELSQEYKDLITNNSLENYVSNKLFDFLKNNTVNTNKNNNYGILTSTQQSNNSAITVNNYGLITTVKGSGQSISSGVGNNYGIIKTEDNYAQLTTNGVINNYGLIMNKGYSAMHVNGAKGVVNNYGILSNGETRAIHTERGVTNNYGVIRSSDKDHVLSVQSDGIMNNYGMVISNVKRTYDIYNNSSTGTINNYGITAFIRNSNAEIGNINGDDFGVILNADNKTNGQRWEIENISLAANGNDHVIKLGTAEGKTTLSQNDFTSDKTTSYTQNEQIEIEGRLDNAHLTGVLDTDGTAESLYKYEGDSLVLNNTTVVGYFQKQGTLLEVNGDLSLAGDTVVNAVGADLSVDTVAVKIADNKSLSLIGGDIKVTGKIVGGEGSKLFNTASQSKEINADVETLNFNNDNNSILSAEENKTDVKIINSNIEKMNVEFTSGDQANKIEIDKNTVVGVKGETEKQVVIDGGKSDKTFELTLNNISNIHGSIDMGDGDKNKLTVAHNDDYSGIIDMGAGTDGEFHVSITNDENHQKGVDNIFDYKLEGVEKVVLNGEGWHIGKEASIIGGKETSTNRQATEINVATGSLHVDMNNDFGNGKVTTSLDKMASEGDLSITTGTKDDISKGTVKFTVGEQFNVSQKEFTVTTNYDVSKADISSAVIFDAEKAGENVKLTVKEASDFELESYKGIYDAVLGALSDNPALREAVNYQNESRFVGMVKEAGDTAEAFYTTGYAVTKDVADTYISVVEDFGRKAGKGEWIAYGKYVNSNTEFDGGNKSKGYDGKINGTVGMVEYGIDDVTSYGFVYGQGDTEVDITGGGKFDGDNSYVGGYIKHRTEKGVDLVGNIGYTESELELDFVSHLKGTALGEHTLITDGKSDAHALTFSLRGKKDYRISDNLILQPVASARYSFINQDEVTSSDVTYKMDAQDITIFEGSLGGNLVREFELNNGRFALSVGAEYVVTDVNKSDNARFTLLEKDVELTGEDDIADNKIEAHIGAEYIHENGVGFDVKYEAVFTDKGDSDRVTAGVSYKF